MEKETLIQNLREKVGENDFSTLSRRTIDSIVDPIMPMFADDEKVTDDTYTLPVNMLRSYIGQYRHDLAEGMKNGKTVWENEQKDVLDNAVKQAVSNARSNWEKEQQGDVKQETPQTEPGIDEDVVVKRVIESLNSENGALSEMKSLLQGFIQKTEEEKRVRTVDGMRKSVRNHLIELDGLDEDDLILEYTMDHLKINENTDIETAKADAVKIYEAAYQRNAKRFGGAAALSSGSVQGKDSAEEFQDFIKSRQEKAEQERIDAENLSKMLI